MFSTKQNCQRREESKVLAYDNNNDLLYFWQTTPKLFLQFEGSGMPYSIHFDLRFSVCAVFV